MSTDTEKTVDGANGNVDGQNGKDGGEPPKPKKIPYWRMVWDQGVVTPEIINYPYPGSGTHDDPYVVTYIPHDPRNPMLFGAVKKWSITMLVAMATLAVALVSSAYTGGLDQIITEFKVGDEVVTLGVSLFVLGFAIGPLFWAPLSELFGRQILFFVTYAALTAFNAGAAGSKNIQTLLVMRFFAGSFGSSPLTNAGGVIADMFAAHERGLAMSIFAAAPFLGPTLGPLIGGFLGITEGWRWVEGFLAIFSGVLWILATLLLPETYSPVLLRKRAAKLSKVTGKVYKAKIDIDQGEVSLSEAFKTALSRPWILLIFEPIVLLLSIYMAIIYGTLYMLFAAFPIVYQQGRGWNEGVGGLAFLGVMVGMLVAVAGTIPDNKRYNKAAEENDGFAPPEARLPPCMVGAIAIPIGLFWFAWTNDPHVQFMASIAAGVPFGMGMVLVFLGVMNYLIDSYTIFAASVLAANSVLRSLFGAAFPLFTTYMYQNLGIHWASSIPAFLALMCAPFPFLFYKYGPGIRKRCKFAAEADAFMRKMREQSEEESDEGEEEETKEMPAAASYGEEAERVRSRGSTTSTSSSSSSESGIRPTSRSTAPQSSLSLSRTRTWKSTKSGRSALSRRGTGYDYNPYDIDRVNTHQSFSRARPRATSTVSQTGGIRRHSTVHEYEGNPYDIDRVNTRDSSIHRSLSRTKSKPGPSSP